MRIYSYKHPHPYAYAHACTYIVIVVLMISVKHDLVRRVTTFGIGYGCLGISGTLNDLCVCCVCVCVCVCVLIIINCFSVQIE